MTQEELEIQKKAYQTIQESSFNEIVSTTKNEINKSFKENVDNLNTACKNVDKLNKQNLARNIFAIMGISFFLLLSGAGSVLYIQNYKDGSRIAAEKAQEALKNEKENIIAEYKNSDAFVEEACKEVASNIQYIKYDYFLHKYMQSKTLNEYPNIKKFDDNYLQRGWSQYKDKYLK